MAATRENTASLTFHVTLDPASWVSRGAKENPLWRLEIRTLPGATELPRRKPSRPIYGSRGGSRGPALQMWLREHMGSHMETVSERRGRHLERDQAGLHSQPKQEAWLTGWQSCTRSPRAPGRRRMLTFQQLLGQMPQKATVRKSVNFEFK